MLLQKFIKTYCRSNELVDIRFKCDEETVSEYYGEANEIPETLLSKKMVQQVRVRTDQRTSWNGHCFVDYSLEILVQPVSDNPKTDGEPTQSEKLDSNENDTTKVEKTNLEEPQGDRGNGNQGNRNQGNDNQGGYNKGNNNQGISNRGDGNRGDCNQGDNNQGDGNQGRGNRGNYNIGRGNRGNNNIGIGNKGDNIVGLFCTQEQPFYLFNKICHMSRLEFERSENYKLLMRLTQAENPKEEWKTFTPEEKQVLQSTENFDPEVFKELFDIDVTEK